MLIALTSKPTNKRRQEEAFGDDKYACYLDCRDSFMGVCILQTN